MATNEVMMTLVIKGARKLKNTQRLGLQDPYLRAWVSFFRRLYHDDMMYARAIDIILYVIFILQISGSKSKQLVKTKTYVDGGTMAVWNESSELRVLDKNKDCLLIEIKNENDFTSDATIGRLKLPCADIPETPVEDWYSIYGDNGDISGEVHLSLSIKGNKNENEDNMELNLNELRISIDPNMSTATPTDELPTVPTELNDEDIPQGWIVQYTKTGCPYYINEDTHITTWIDPRKVFLKG